MPTLTDDLTTIPLGYYINLKVPNLYRLQFPSMEYFKHYNRSMTHLYANSLAGCLVLVRYF